MNVLLIWENVPESTDAYLIKDVSEEDLTRLQLAHGQLINNCDDEGIQPALDFINLYLGPIEYIEYSREFMNEIGFDPTEYGKWNQYKKPFQALGVNIKDADLLILSGFLL